MRRVLCTVFCVFYSLFVRINTMIKHTESPQVYTWVRVFSPPEEKGGGCLCYTDIPVGGIVKLMFFPTRGREGAGITKGRDH